MAAGDMRDHSIKSARPQTTDDTPTVVAALTYAGVPDLTYVRVLVTGSARRTDSPGDKALHVQHRAECRRYDADGTGPGLAVLGGEDASQDIQVGVSSLAVEVVPSGNDIQILITGSGPSETVRWMLRAEYELTEETVDIAPA